MDDRYHLTNLDASVIDNLDASTRINCNSPDPGSDTGVMFPTVTDVVTSVVKTNTSNGA